MHISFRNLHTFIYDVRIFNSNGRQRSNADRRSYTKLIELLRFPSVGIIKSMTRGRKPIPTALHELNGSYDKDPQRRRQNEPVAPPEAPALPDSLDEYGKCEWYYLTELLAEMNLLSRADKAAIEIYCQTFSEWRKAVDVCNQHGAWTTFHDKDGNIQTRRNEFDKIRERSAECLRRWLVEFGLTPSSRARVQVNKPDEGDELDRFFSADLGN